jgi:hypothetical protein
MTMRVGKYFMTLSVAAVVGALGVASASAGNGGEHRDDAGGIQVGPLGQAFVNPPAFESRPYAAGAARAQAEPGRRPIRASAAARDAAGSAVTLDPLAMQHKDPGWKHNYQSWCDVDPNCNGWAEKMQEYEAGR